jgi:hypothetical protein
LSDTAPRCFVIGPIGDAGSPTRRKADWVLHGLIKPVLEDPTFGYKVKRADQDPNPGSISDAMINDIYDAELVVADLTGFNPNAFYELGIRHAFQKPAIHIIAERGIKPPFDNQDQRTIEVDFEDFHHVEEARRSLQAAINYVRGADFMISNPVTRARGIAELKASGDPKDVLLADLRGDLAVMSDRVRRLEHSSRSNAKFPTDRKTRYSRIALDRFGEYYPYIREAVEKRLQVPFAEELIDAAMNLESAERFVDWYVNENGGQNSGWAQNIGRLNDESFELLSNGSIIKSFSDTQKSLITAEKRARLSKQAEAEK